MLTEITLRDWQTMLVLSTFSPASPQSAADEVEQSVGHQLLAVRVHLAEGTVEKQHGQTVYGGPHGLVEAVAAIGGEYADADQIVDAPDQNVEWMVAFHLGLGAVGLAYMRTAARSR